MQEERWENLTGNPLKAKHIQELWDYWRETRPDYPQFLKDTVPAIMNFSGNLTVIKASALAVTVWEKFQKTDEASKVHSTFSKLSLSEFGRTAGHVLLSGSKYCSSISTTGSGPPLIPQDKGVEALHCAMNDGHYPPSADDATTQKLFPKDEWITVSSDAGTKSESKLNIVFETQTEEAHKLANSVFIKPKKELCKPKIPDFVLVDKEFQEVPTPDTVGALLFAQSTTESSKSYATEAAVGEAVAVAQVLLRNASQQRQFIITGVTNF